ncbi:MAG: hypothetical protein LC664_08090 [Flavobacteriales bacterium]|nr:hypothetical protein [Flavobacteriales bacterium]
MKNLADASRYINSFPRPNGLNAHSWSALKKLALHAWACYLNKERFNHRINFLCKDFYLMIRDPQGEFIVPKSSFSYDPSL